MTPNWRKWLNFITIATQMCTNLLCLWLCPKTANKAILAYA
ncbi:hypothetical protein AO372_1928 [Moraxella catarrhalis]|nr:hypothetical protein AO372_1928 [Moraxella catarrhalis]